MRFPVINSNIDPISHRLATIHVWHRRTTDTSCHRRSTA